MGMVFNYLFKQVAYSTPSLFRIFSLMSAYRFVCVCECVGNRVCLFNQTVGLCLSCV